MIKTIVGQMKNIFGDDHRRINHALAVLKNATFLWNAEFWSNNEMKKVVELAAVLHDIGIKQAEAKYNSAAPVYQHREGPPLARKVMEKAGINEAVIKRVCYIIGNHHLKSKIDGMDFQLVWEADLLVNLPDLAIMKSHYIRYKKMVLNNFKTKTGMRMALDLYSQK